MKQQILLPGVSLSASPALSDVEQPLPATFIESPAGRYPAFVDGQSTADSWPSTQSMLSSLIVFEPHRPTPRPIDVLGIPPGQNIPSDYEERVSHADVIAAEAPLLQRLFPQWQDTASPTLTPATADSSKTSQRGTTTRRKKDRSPLTKKQCEFVCISALQVDQAFARIHALHRASKSIVILCEGDPLFMGIGGLLRNYFDPRHLRFTPAVSLIQEVAARMVLPWQGIQCLSLRGTASWHQLHTAVRGGHPVCLLTDADTTPDSIARHLLDRGVEWYAITLFERLGTEQERQRACSLYEAAALTDWHIPAIMMLTPEGAPRGPLLGLEDPTPAVGLPLAARATALSLLQIAPPHIVWHVGAGTGTLALEASALASQGAVFALERSAGRALGLRELRRRYGAAQVEVCHAAAPECFTRLPRPDRICVSGGLHGDNADLLLQESMRLLRPQGRMVVLCDNAQSLHTCLESLQNSPAPVQVLHTAFSPLSDAEAPFPPLTPLYLVLCVKPA